MIRTEINANLNHFNDFYYLEALKVAISANKVTSPQLEFSKAVERLELDLSLYQKDFNENLAQRVFMYLWAACLGETRHAAGSRAKDFFIQEFGKLSRGEVFGQATDYPPSVHNVKTLIKVFEQEWRGSFGGKAWWDIAKSLEMYQTQPAQVFLDHVVDLQHNNGTVFSKSESEDSINFEVSYHGNFREFLDWKFRYDILKQMPSFTTYITGKTVRLLTRYTTIFRQKEMKWVEPCLDNLSSYHIEWGNGVLKTIKKWADWASCSKSNTPDPRWLFHKAGASDLHVKTMTEKQFKKALKDIKKIALAKSVGYNLKKELDKYEQAVYNKWVRYCCEPKQKVTYTVIPVKYKSVLSTIIIQIPLPFYGHGEQTDYGFQITGKTQGVNAKGEEAGFGGEKGFVDGHMVKSDYGVLKLYSREQSWNWDDKKLEALFT